MTGRTREGQRLRGRQAEAARNDALVLEAARDVVAQFGADATVAAIAQRSGVGVGSLYRRYATKEELFQHLCLIAMQQAAEAAADGLEQAAGWAGLELYIRRAVQGRIGVLSALAGSVQVSPEMLAVARQAQRLLAELLRRAQVERAVRKEVTPIDIALLVEQFSRVPLDSSFVEVGRQRLLQLALDGLRATNAPALPSPPPQASEYEARWLKRSG